MTLEGFRLVEEDLRFLEVGLNRRSDDGGLVG